MNIVGETRVATASEFENQCEEARKAAEEDVYRWDGAKRALAGASKSVQDLAAHIARDVEEGKLDVEAAGAAKRYIMRASIICDNLRLKAEVNGQKAQGRSEAMSMAAGIAGRIGQWAQEKLDNPPEAPRAAESSPKNKHPGNKVAELRERKIDLPGGIEKIAKKTTKKATRKKATRKKK